MLSTVVSLPCEVSTEALISDFELPRRFTAKATNLADGCLLIGSVSEGIQNPAQRTHSKIVIPSSRPSPGLPDLEQSHAAPPRARPLLRRPSAGSVLSPGQPCLVLRSDAGASSDGLGVGPACIRLVRVGPSREVPTALCGVVVPSHGLRLLITRLTIRQL